MKNTNAIVTLFFIIFTTYLSAVSQAITSPATTYYIDQSGSFSPVAGSGTEVPIRSDISERLPIGFTFDFFGNEYEEFYIAKNGFVGFGSYRCYDIFCGDEQKLPDANSSKPNNLIALAWGALRPDASSTIAYFNQGMAPHRTLVVNFIDVMPSAGGARVTAQLVLHESTNDIEIHTTSAVSNGRTRTVGIENSDGTIAYTVPGRNAQDWSATNDYVRFYRKPRSEAVNDAGVLSLDSISVICAGDNALYATLANYGTNPIRNVTVRWAFDGAEQPAVNWSGVLDTIGGAGTHTAGVLLGNKTFPAGQSHTIVARTENPNGVADIVHANDTLRLVIAPPGLQGTYTIGGASPDYPTFTDALQALHTIGICDRVTFNVRPGTYNEQLQITAFPGNACATPVVFQSETGDRDGVVLTHQVVDSTKNYTVQLNGVLGITFRNITLASTDTVYGRVVDLRNGASCHTFSGNLIRGTATASASTNMALVYSPPHTQPDNDNHFTGNHLLHGSYGFFYAGCFYNGGFGGDWIYYIWKTGLRIAENTLQDQSAVGIYTSAVSDPLIEKNTITTNTTRKFTGVDSDHDDQVSIRGNKISIPNGGTGISYYHNSGNAFRGSATIYNNFVSIGGTSVAYGIGIWEGRSFSVAHNNVHIYNTSPSSAALYQGYTGGFGATNNVLVNSGGGYAFYKQNDSGHGGSYTDYNDLYTTGDVLVYDDSDGTFINAYPTLKLWQYLGGGDGGSPDSRSISIDPLFVSDTDLHVSEIALNGAGSPRLGVTEDIDGELRDASTPDIGADEFIPPAIDAAPVAFQSFGFLIHAGTSDVVVRLKNNGVDTLLRVKFDWEIDGVPQDSAQWTGHLPSGEVTDVVLGTGVFEAGVAYDLIVWSSRPNDRLDGNISNDTLVVSGIYPALNGTYTIGGVDPDFATFTEAVEAMQGVGVSDSVVFNVRPGTYHEQVTMADIPGAGCDTPVIFRSETGDRTSVVLTYGSTGSGSNYTLQLDGVSGITFKNMTLAASNENYGRVVDLRKEASCNTFSGNTIRGVPTTSIGEHMALVRSLNDYSFICFESNNKNQFTGNHFLYGSYGYKGECSEYTFREGLRIVGNTLQDQSYRGIDITYAGDAIIEKNTLSTNSARADFRGINMSDNYGIVNVLSNKLHIPNGGYGIYSKRYGKSLIANNFVSIGGNSTAYGIYASSYPSSSFSNDIYHNNIHIYATSLTGSALYSDRNNDIRNNVLVNSGGGYAFYAPDTTDTYADYNDLYTTGVHLAYYGGDRADLAAWQSATGWDTHSLSVDPQFFSTTDLHIIEQALTNAGMLTGKIFKDIDGELRDASTPDMGADEFNPPSSDIGIAALQSPRIPFNAGSSDVIVQLKNVGVDTLTRAKVYWEHNGLLQDSLDWIGSLPIGGTIDLALGTKTFHAVVSHTLKVWTSKPNGKSDENVSNDTLLVSGLYPALNGTYTIGGVDPDFATFTEAAEVMQQGGVSDTVIFNVRPGIYNEQIWIPGFPGNDCNVSVVFQSENGDNTSVVLTHNSTDNRNNFTVQLDGASGITFQNITLAASNPRNGRVIDLRNGASCNTFSGNIIEGIATTSTSNDRALIYSPKNTAPDNDNQFTGNALMNGSYGFQYESNNSNEETGLRIADNTLHGQGYAGIFLTGQNSPIIAKNTIMTTSARTNFYGIYLNQINDSLKVQRNKIHIPNGGYGIIQRLNEGSTDAQGLVANNFISIGGNAFDSYGIFSNDNDYQNYYHNNVYFYGTRVSTGVGAFRHESGSKNKIYNNILVTKGGGYTFLTTTTDIDADYNDLYTNGPNLAYYGGDITDLNTWQEATGGDTHSLSIDPRFLSDTDLHVREIALKKAGIPIAEVTDDIDGEARDTSAPDMGADEFTLPVTDAGIRIVSSPHVPFDVGSSDVVVQLYNNGSDTLTNVMLDWKFNDVPQESVYWTGSLPTGYHVAVLLGIRTFDMGTAYRIEVRSSNPNGQSDVDVSNDTLSVSGLYAALNGVYTIGGVDPDFATFTEAAEMMQQGGVSDTVIFNVRPGIYNEQIRMTTFPGNDCNTPVIFQSEDGNSTRVILTYDSASRWNNYTLQLDGVSGFTFRNMTLTSTDTNYGRVIDLRNGASCHTFSGNIIEGVASSSSSRDMALIYSPNNTAPDNDNQFMGNTLMNGSYGFRYESGFSNKETGLRIVDNTLHDQRYAGISLTGQNSPVIAKNTIITTRTGIQLESNYDSVKVLGNKIHIIDGSHGIYNNSGRGSITAQGLIANNFISGRMGVGIYSFNGSYQHYYHNNVHLYGTSSSSTAFYRGYTSYFEAYNNILVNNGEGFAFSANGGGFISDYNDLYTLGEHVAKYGWDFYTDLAAWQEATGGDTHSLSIDPRFLSDTDLHVREIALKKAGIPIAEVTDDIDGEPRDASAPDMGADKFTLPVTDAGIRIVSSPHVPFDVGSSDIVVQLYNNGSDTLTNVMLDWKFNDVPQESVYWTGSLPTGYHVAVLLGIRTFYTGTAYRIEVRSSNPNGRSDADVSNDTLSVSGLYAALNGVYTIGGVDPDFATFTEAAEVMQRGRVSDTVIFNVRPGIYNEQIRMTTFPGNDCNTSVIFQSETGDSTDVVLTYNAGATNNYTVQLDGVSGITFRHLTLEASDSNYGRVIDLRNGASCHTFSGNIIKGVATSSSSDDMALIYSPNNTEPNDNQFMGNALMNGSYGFRYESSFGNKETGLRIIDNNLHDQGYAGIFLAGQKSPVIAKNTIMTTSTRTIFYGIYLNQINDSLKVQSNKIHIPNGGYGLYNYSGNRSAETQGLIANNFISIGGSNTAYGIYSNYGTYQNYYHNTVHIYSTTVTTSASAFYNRNGSDKKIYNNILVHSGGGYAFYTNTSSFTADYNNLYTTDTSLAYYSGNRTDLAAWQEATGGDVNSLSVDPGFVSDTDLHVSNMALDSAGFDTGIITLDIDGEFRGSPPDIGADEFIPIPLLSVDISGDTKVYSGYPTAECTALEAVVLGGTPGYRYLWSTGATTAQIEVCPSENTEYAVTVTDTSGTVATVTVRVCVEDVTCNRLIGTGITVCSDNATQCVPAWLVGLLRQRGVTLGACNSEACTDETAARMAIDRDENVVVAESDSFVAAYPNPFDRSTTIRMYLPGVRSATLKIHDLNGRVVAELFDGEVDAAAPYYEFEFVPEPSLPKGVYYYRLMPDNGKVVSKKMVLR